MGGSFWMGVLLDGVEANCTLRSFGALCQANVARGSALGKPS